MGSGGVEVTSAVLEMLPWASGRAVPLIRIVCVFPLTMVPKPRIPGHELNVTPPSVENSTPVSAAGILSVNVTFSAEDGSAFDAVMV